MQFSLLDSSNPQASSEEIFSKFKSLVIANDDEGDITPVSSTDNEDEPSKKEEDVSEETDDPTKPENVARRRRKLRIARLKRKSMAVRAYEFSGAKDGISGIVFIEINKVLDLPPERNGEPATIYMLISC